MGHNSHGAESVDQGGDQGPDQYFRNGFARELRNTSPRFCLIKRNIRGSGRALRSKNLLRTLRGHQKDLTLRTSWTPVESICVFRWPRSPSLRQENVVPRPLSHSPRLANGGGGSPTGFFARTRLNAGEKYLEVLGGNNPGGLRPWG